MKGLARMHTQNWINTQTEQHPERATACDTANCLKNWWEYKTPQSRSPKV
jgi:hypothetical protein